MVLGKAPDLRETASSAYPISMEITALSNSFFYLGINKWFTYHIGRLITSTIAAICCSSVIGYLGQLSLLT